MRLILPLALAMILTSGVSASANEWQLDGSQGFREAQIRIDGGSDLTVACAADDGRPGSVRLNVAGAQPGPGETVDWHFDETAERLTIQFGDDGRLTTGCPVCDAAFATLITALKRYGKATATLQSGASATFPLSGSTWAIGDCEIKDTQSAEAGAGQPSPEPAPAAEPEPATAEPAVQPVAKPGALAAEAEPGAAPTADEGTAATQQAEAPADPAPAGDAGAGVEIFRLEACQGTRGIGLITYSGAGTDAHVLTDLCFDEASGAFRSYEEIDGFQLALADGPFRSFETTQPAASGARETLYFNTIDPADYFPLLASGSAEMQMVSWVSAGSQTDGRTLRNPAAYFAHLSPGFFGGVAMDVGLPDGRYHAYAEVQFSSDLDFPAPYASRLDGKIFPILGQLSAEGGALSGEIGGAGMTLQVSARWDGTDLAGSIKVDGQNPNADLDRPEDWSGLSAEADQMLGRVVGRSGDEVYLIAPARFAHVSQGGAEHHLWMIVSLFALRAD